MSVRRVVLFDIDGTLVWGGPAKDSFVDAMVDTFGTPGDFENVSFAGKTDPQIARELLLSVGFDDGRVTEGLPDLFARYLTNLEARLPDRPVSVLPGVPDLLSALAERAEVGVGLLTGNIAGGARLKLASGGLWGHFAFGSYGSDHEHRDELPGIAMVRARDLWGAHLEPGAAIVIGDTPRDVQCGKAGQTRTMAVATGSFSTDELAATNPDHVLGDLTQTEAVVDLILG
ncbi:MAG: HAD family hydrolase [Gemmatimonadota bacterium]